MSAMFWQQKQYLTNIVSNVSNVNLNDIHDWILQNKTKSTLVSLPLFISVRYIYYKIQRKYYNYPPGPIGIPFFGYFFHRIFGWLIFKIKAYGRKGMSEHYGPIFMYYSLGRTFVNINGSELTKKIITLKPNKTNQPHALHRPINRKYEMIVTANDDGTDAFAFDAHYQSWHKRRKLINTALMSLCTSTYINDIVDQIMYKTVFPAIDQLISKNPGIPSLIHYILCVSIIKPTFTQNLRANQMNQNYFIQKD